MSRRTRTAAILLSGAALAGSGAPVALAHHGHDRDGRAGFAGHRHHHGHGLARLARELGVTKEQLRTALKAVAEQQKAAAQPASFKSLLAAQLGKPEDQVKAAFQQARATAHTKDEFVAAFASALGVDQSTVEPAFKAAREEQMKQFKAARDAFIAALAQQLGIPQEKVAAAFEHKHFARHH